VKEQIAQQLYLITTMNFLEIITEGDKRYYFLLSQIVHVSIENKDVTVQMSDRTLSGVIKNVSNIDEIVSKMRGERRRK